MFTTTNEIALELITAHKELNNKIESTPDVALQDKLMDSLFSIEDKLAAMFHLDSCSVGQALSSM